VTVLPVDRFGMVDPDDVRNRKAVTPKTILITVMHAVRFSLGRATTWEELEEVLGMLKASF
jgi:cysteine sulfinate desulfinase/cysteine desulfurase-like protein